MGISDTDDNRVCLFKKARRAILKLQHETNSGEYQRDDQRPTFDFSCLDFLTKQVTFKLQLFELELLRFFVVKGN